jgi:hypothetical protein
MITPTNQPTTRSSTTPTCLAVRALLPLPLLLLNVGTDAAVAATCVAAATAAAAAAAANAAVDGARRAHPQLTRWQFLCWHCHA